MAGDPAIDDTTLNLPNHVSTAQVFGLTANAKRPQARLSQLLDLSNKLTLDVQISPLGMGERALAQRHADVCKPGDLILADRGYAGAAMYQYWYDREIDFCIRVPVSQSHLYYQFYGSGQTEQEATLPECSRPVRLVRVPLEADEDEVLVTSLLDQDQWPAEHFKEIYFARWGIEEDYKTLKSRLQIEQFSGKKVHAVLQDIYATMIHKNIVALACQCAQHQVDGQIKKHPYKVNFTQAARLVKWFWWRVTRGNWLALVRHISRYAHAVRPGRHYARRVRKRQPPASAYKQ